MLPMKAFWLLMPRAGKHVPVWDVNGWVVGAVAVFRDIGEVKRLAEEIAGLRETQSLLEAIINCTQGGETPPHSRDACQPCLPGAA